MTLLVATIIFILGTTIGSFLSVLIFRIHENKKGIFLGKSICPKCEQNLKWQHLVPVLSWIFLKGKCAYCKAKISPSYFIFEITTGALFLASFLHWNFIEVIPSSINNQILTYAINWTSLEQLTFNLIIFTFLLAIFFYDFLYQEIPDSLSLTAISIAIAGGLVLGTPSPVSMTLGGVLLFLFFAIQFYVSKGKWIGGGDLRLGILIGVLLGVKLGFIALIISYILGSLISIALIVAGRANKKTHIAFGPFLATGTIIVVFYGQEILNWYLTFLIH